MKRIEDIIILKFISLEKPFEQWTMSFSPIFRMAELTELRSSKKTFRWLEKIWQRKKKWHVSSASREQRHNGFNVSWKLCLNLCSLRWLKPTRRRVNNFKRETSLVPKVLFPINWIKSKSVLQNNECEGAWQIHVSSLFHFLIVLGKK